MADNFHSAHCVAITRTGKRCTGRWSSALPCLFAWDAITGKGVDGPHIVLCHRHRHWTHERGIRTGKRFPVVHGWLGAANRYGYSSAVFEHERDSWVPAAWWWERRRPVTAGDSGRVDAA